MRNLYGIIGNKIRLIILRCFVVEQSLKLRQIGFGCCDDFSYFCALKFFLARYKDMLKPKRQSRRGMRASLVTRDMEQLTSHTGNVYEAIASISKRARHIAVIQKEELSQKISEFATTVDNLEEVFENREQIEISKYYERLPKPTTTATEELMDGELIIKKPKAADEDDLDS